MNPSKRHPCKPYSVEEVYSELKIFLQKHLCSSVIVLVQLDEKRDKGYVYSITGITKSILNKVISLIGLNPVGKHFDNTEYSRRNIYSSRHFEQFSESLYEFSGKIMPEWIFNAAEKLIKVDRIYYKGLSCDNQTMGTIVVLPRNDEEKKLAGIEDNINKYALKMKEILDNYNDEIIGVGTKERFTRALLANINHELRTPLNGIIGLMDAGLKLLNEDEITKDLTHGIWQNSIDLTNKLDNILLISELEANTISLKHKRQNIESLIIQINNLIRAFNNEFHTRSIHFSHEERIDIKELTNIDLYYFDYAIKELLRNAIKFSEDKVNIKLKTSSSNIIIDIIDYGIGMSAQEQEGTCSPFMKKDTGLNTKSGLGIGLNIVNHIAKHHNWDIKICSEINKGTQVRLYLPICLQTVLQ